MNPLLFPLVDKIIDTIGNFFPSQKEKDAAKLALLQAEQSGQLEETKVQLSAILAEANSSDKWTSRARPSFLYVMYVLILASIPMGGLYAYSPATAGSVVQGFQQWLNAIPESLYQLFGVVSLGYVGARSWEKVKGVTK